MKRLLILAALFYAASCNPVPIETPQKPTEKKYEILGQIGLYSVYRLTVDSVDYIVGVSNAGDAIAITKHSK